MLLKNSLLPIEIGYVSPNIGKESISKDEEVVYFKRESDEYNTQIDHS